MSVRNIPNGGNDINGNIKNDLSFELLDPGSFPLWYHYLQLTLACFPVGLIGLQKEIDRCVRSGFDFPSNFFQVNLFQPLRLFIQLRGSFPLSYL